MFTRDKLAYQPLALPARPVLEDAAMAAAATAYDAAMATPHTVRDFTDRPPPRAIFEICVQTALAPSGANHKSWHFSLIGDTAMKAENRAAAEACERKFYNKAQHDEWLKALEPIGTNTEKPHLQIAPWLIVIFAERYGQFDDGTRYKNYYVTESVGIATGFLISALHTAGLACLTHTPNPMGSLTKICRRPASNKPLMILAIGHPAADATIPAAAKNQKTLGSGDDCFRLNRARRIIEGPDRDACRAPAAGAN